MSKEAGWSRMTGRVTAYIEKYATRVGIEKREEVLELFDNIHRLFPDWMIMICPMIHPGINYVSKNTPFVLGYSKEYIIENSRIDKFFPLVYESDRQELERCLVFMHDFFDKIPPEEHHRYRSVMHFRFRKANGQIIYLHDEKAVLNLRGSGNLYYGLLRDVTAERIFTGVKAEIFIQEHVLTKIQEYKPADSKKTLSKREQELLALIKQGLSTKEIAWSLDISHHTVRNIKSKLFEKYKVSNSIELLNMAG